MVLVFFVCSDFYITVLYKFSVIHQQIFVSYSQFICIIIYSSANNPPRPDWLWGPTQSPVQRVKEWVALYFYSPNTPSWCGAQLRKKHRDNFTFNFYPHSFGQYHTKHEFQFRSRNQDKWRLRKWPTRGVQLNEGYEFNRLQPTIRTLDRKFWFSLVFN